MSTTITTGAVFRLVDEFSRPGAKLLDVLKQGQTQAKELQVQLDKINMGTSVKTITDEIEEMVKASRAGGEQIALNFAGMNDKVADIFEALPKEARASFTQMGEDAKLGARKVVGAFDTLGKDMEPAWAKAVGTANSAFGEIGAAGGTLKTELVSLLGDAGTEAAKALAGGVEAAAPVMFSPVLDAAKATATEVGAIMAGVGRDIEASAAAARAAGVAGGGGGASLGARTRGARSAHDAHAGGLHFGPMGTHVGGTHVGMGGDGIVPAVGGFFILEGLKEGAEAGMNFQHWESQYEGSGISKENIDLAKKAAWANAGMNPNLSAIQGMQMIFEANKMTGDVSESIDLLPTLATTSMAMQSVKAEDLHSHFNEGHQIFNFSKYLEEVGATANTADHTPEEKLKRTQDYAREAMRTMVFSRGVTDGNSLYAMSNNSKGTAANWSMRMATVYAPLIGDVMRHSKLGNADFMALKSYQGGHITSDAVEGLMKYGLAEVGRDTYQDSKKQWHLKANSPFAEGMESDLVEWSHRQLEKLQANGYDINNQTVMNGLVNAIGSNGSTANLMRAVLEPNPRNLLNKEIIGRDRVPDNAASILQDRDPVLKLDALHKKWEDLMTALGDPLVDPAIAALTKITSAINTFAQAMHDHPDITQAGAEAAGVAGVGLLGYGAGKMLGPVSA